jgi:hypothetical protein
MSQPAQGPKPPFTCMLRLDEHDAPPRTHRDYPPRLVIYHDLRPHTSRQFGQPRSWLTSHVTADCRAPVAQP